MSCSTEGDHVFALDMKFGEDCFIGRDCSVSEQHEQ